MEILKIDSPTSSSTFINTHPLSQTKTAAIFEPKMSSRASMRKFRSESDILTLKLRTQLDNELSSTESCYDRLSDTVTQYSGSNPTSCDSAEVEELVSFLGKMDEFLAASQMHEQSGQLELALEDVEQALEFLDQVAQKHGSMDGVFGGIRKYNHFTLRKGAILLALGKKEEAVEVFLNHPPKDVATILLYRFIEQKFHVQLLALTDLVQNTDGGNYVERAESLFLAGHYEEAELLLKEKPYGGFLRCACLTMLGRMEEARELREKEVMIDPHFDSMGTPDHMMFHMLHGDIPDQFWQDILLWQNWEWLNQFPIRTFWVYSDKF